jgi:GNAT superfamily N-acetyltransferase
MTIRNANISDKEEVLHLLDEFRADCMTQITGKECSSKTAITQGVDIYDALLERQDYCIKLLLDDTEIVVGIITGYLCPVLRSGEMRAEVEEFFIKSEFRGKSNATNLMDAFFDWCKDKNVKKVNLESDIDLHRAHSFYKKYGFEIKAQRFVKKLE